MTKNLMAKKISLIVLSLVMSLSLLFGISALTKVNADGDDFIIDYSTVTVHDLVTDYNGGNSFTANAWDCPYLDIGGDPAVNSAYRIKITTGAGYSYLWASFLADGVGGHPAGADNIYGGTNGGIRFQFQNGAVHPVAFTGGIEVTNQANPTSLPIVPNTSYILEVGILDDGSGTSVLYAKADETFIAWAEYATGTYNFGRYITFSPNSHGDHTFSAAPVAKAWVITYAESEQGVIKGGSMVFPGDETEITIEPKPGYALDTLTVGGVAVDKASITTIADSWISKYTYTFAPTADTSISATYKVVDKPAISRYDVVTDMNAGNAINVYSYYQPVAVSVPSGVSLDSNFAMTFRLNTLARWSELRMHIFAGDSDNVWCTGENGLYVCFDGSGWIYDGFTILGGANANLTQVYAPTLPSCGTAAETVFDVEVGTYDIANNRSVFYMIMDNELSYAATYDTGAFNFGNHFIAGTGNDGHPAQIIACTYAEITGTEIAMNYGIALNFNVQVAGNVKAFITYKDATEEVAITNRVVKFDGILPQHFNDEVTLTLKNGDNVLDTLTTSVADYCKDVIASDADQMLKQLATDVLYYGAAAQKYIEHDIENLATNGIDATPSTFDINSVAASIKALSGEANAEYYFVKAAVAYANNVKMIFTFVAPSNDENLKVFVGEEEITGIVKGDSAGENLSYYTFEYDVVAYDFNADLEFSIKSGDVVKGQTLAYNLNSYIKECYVITADAEYKELLERLYNYCASLQAYVISMLA